MVDRDRLPVAPALYSRHHTLLSSLQFLGALQYLVSELRCNAEAEAHVKVKTRCNTPSSSTTLRLLPWLHDCGRPLTPSILVNACWRSRLLTFNPSTLQPPPAPRPPPPCRPAFLDASAFSGCPYLSALGTHLLAWPRGGTVAARGVGVPV